MPLSKDYDKTLAEKTNEYLFDMLFHPDDYLPEALTLARREIQHRNLNPVRVAQLEARSETVRAQELRIANEPLSLLARIVLVLIALVLFLRFSIVVFLFPIGSAFLHAIVGILGFLTGCTFLHAIIAYRYRDMGYTRKSRECWKLLIYGGILGFTVTLFFYLLVRVAYLLQVQENIK